MKKDSLESLVRPTVSIIDDVQNKIINAINDESSLYSKLQKAQNN
jgi:hypothetical protein